MEVNKVSMEYFVDRDPPCPHCDRPYEKISIGVSAAGWMFSFRKREDLHLTTARKWFDFLAEVETKGSRIRNEYGDVLTAERFREMVDAKMPLPSYPDNSPDDKDADGYDIRS
jgi:hypothetical protein